MHTLACAVGKRETKLTGEGESESNEETGANEETDILRSRLERDTNQHESRTNPDGQSTTKAIRKVGSKGIGRECTDVLEDVSETQECKHPTAKPDLNGIKQTELTTLWVMEVILPLVQGLETVHQTTVESIP